MRAGPDQSLDARFTPTFTSHHNKRQKTKALAKTVSVKDEGEWHGRGAASHTPPSRNAAMPVAGSPTRKNAARAAMQPILSPRPEP